MSYRFASVIFAARVQLVPATSAHVRAELEGHSAFAQVIGAAIPESWPPAPYDRLAQEYFLRALQETGEHGVGWFGWYAIRNRTEETAATVVGCGGYFGPPSASGVVEVGYSICPEWRGLGYASEMTGALVTHIRQVSEVTRVIAHTDPGNKASISVLLKSGFAQVALTDQPGALLFEWTPRPDANGQEPMAINAHVNFTE